MCVAKLCNRCPYQWLYWVLSGWQEVETAAVEVDGGLEVVSVAEASRGVLHPFDLGVEAFAQRVGNRMSERLCQKLVGREAPRNSTLVTQSNHAHRKVDRTARDAAIFRRHLPAWGTSTNRSSRI